MICGRIYKLYEGAISSFFLAVKFPGAYAALGNHFKLCVNLLSGVESMHRTGGLSYFQKEAHPEKMPGERNPVICCKRLCQGFGR